MRNTRRLMRDMNCWAPAGPSVTAALGCLVPKVYMYKRKTIYRQVQIDLGLMDEAASHIVAYNLRT